MRRMMREGKSFANDESLRARLRLWAAGDFEGALAFAASLKKEKGGQAGKDYAEALGIVLAVMAKRDPGEAWRRFRDLGGSSDWAIIGPFFKEWAAADLAGAMRFADSQDRFGLGGWQVAPALLAKVEKEQLLEVVPLLAELKNDQLFQWLTRSAGAKFSEEDWRDYVAFVEALGGVSKREIDIGWSKLMTEAVKKEVMAVAERFGRVQPPALRARLWNAALDPLLEETGHGTLHQLLGSAYAADVAAGLALIETWWTVPVAEADALVAKMPDGETRWKLLTQLARQAAGDFEVKRAEMLLNLLPDQQGAGVFQELGKAWHQSDPAQAGAWLDSLPAGSAERDWAAVGLLEGWSFIPLEKAGAWIDGIASGEARAAAAKAMSNKRLFYDAASWAPWVTARRGLTAIQAAELLER